jgi:hypothetical protein
MDTEKLSKLKSVTDYIDYILKSNEDKFTFSDISMYLIPEQASNQYRLKVDLDNTPINESVIISLINDVESSLSEYEYHLLNTQDKEEQKKLKGLIQTLKEQLSELSKYKSEPTPYSRVINYLVHHKYGRFTYENLLRFLTESELVEKCFVFPPLTQVVGEVDNDE